MKTSKQTQLAARVITYHQRFRESHGVCRCGRQWTPLHLAEQLEASGLLSTLETSDKEKS